MLDTLRQRLAEYPGARIELKEFENGPPIEAPIAMRIEGPDLDTLRTLAARVEQIMAGTAGTQYVRNPIRLRRTDLRLHVDRQKAGLLGIPSVEIDRTLRLGIAGLEAGLLSRRAMATSIPSPCSSRTTGARAPRRCERIYVPQRERRAGAAGAGGHAGIRGHSHRDRPPRAGARGEHHQLRGQRLQHRSRDAAGAGRHRGAGRARRVSHLSGRRDREPAGELRRHRQRGDRGGVRHPRHPRARVPELPLHAGGGERDSAGRGGRHPGAALHRLHAELHRDDRLRGAGGDRDQDVDPAGGLHRAAAPRRAWSSTRRSRRPARSASCRSC